VSGAILALDVGSVRLGVAIAERVDLPAMPLTTLAHVSRRADIDAILSLARERDAKTIVVGYPLRLDGSPGPAAERVDRFVADLRARFDGEVATYDERLTSAAAAKKLMQGTLSGSKRRELVDRLAAVEILDSYLQAARRG
jgi:putative Holliday junction resolvase